MIDIGSGGAVGVATSVPSVRGGLSYLAANTASMEDPLGQSRPGRLIQERIERKGLRPRLAAGLIAVLWLAAIAGFGVIMRLVDPDSFDTIWDGMWWATQTVTTVGYGDIVPDQAGGQVIAAVLMVGGLSFFAVITGVITSEFVTRAQERRRAQRVDSLEQTIDSIARDVADIRERLGRLGDGDVRPPPT
jgi:voltage-gated potassium channel